MQKKFPWTLALLRIFFVLQILCSTLSASDPDDKDEVKKQNHAPKLAIISSSSETMKEFPVYQTSTSSTISASSSSDSSSVPVVEDGEQNEEYTFSALSVPESEIDPFASIFNSSMKFKEIIKTALHEKYCDLYPQVIIDSVLESFQRWSPSIFFEKYMSSENTEFSKEPKRLNVLCAQLKDIQLQLFYIQEVDMGNYNRIIDSGYDPKDPNKKTFLLLARLSIDQSLIVRSRILWEKIMNFVYYLINNIHLEPGRKSKKGKFFDFVKKDPIWKFLAPYEIIVRELDENYRTPEVHKGSILKKELVSAKIDQNELLKSFNYASNAIWENILLIISGKSAAHFTDLHSSPVTTPTTSPTDSTLP